MVSSSDQIENSIIYNSLQAHRNSECLIDFPTGAFSLYFAWILHSTIYVWIVLSCCIIISAIGNKAFFSNLWILAVAGFWTISQCVCVWETISLPSIIYLYLSNLSSIYLPTYYLSICLLSIYLSIIYLIYYLSIHLFNPLSIYSSSTWSIHYLFIHDPSHLSIIYYLSIYVSVHLSI